MFSKLKQFKDLRDQAKQLQDVLSQEVVTVKAAGDKVSLTMDGNLNMKELDIHPELLGADKKSKLESAIKEAHGEALKKMQRVMAMKMKDMGGLPQIPGMN
ncbi:MAG TPA: YbaB/EbfC family nucleoid-associated protein [Candidatus Kapabacteria bacterium]|nr:YbaB/EbfC family nucleoid-associated protein [Candidatus Kapabacteria bacterium]